MAEVGKVTIEVTPVIPEDLQEQVETAVREAVAEVLRKVADGLTGDDQPRYHVEQVDGKWGVIDRKRPSEWAGYGADTYAKELAEEAAIELNADGSDRDEFIWTAPGTIF